MIGKGVEDPSILKEDDVVIVEEGTDTVFEELNEHKAFLPFFAFSSSRLPCNFNMPITPAGTHR